ncbi:MAG: acylase [Woeseia sp.]
MQQRAKIAITILPVLVAGCFSTADAPTSVKIQRTTHGIAHIEAPDYESLAYGVAYAHAEDNVCQTADHLVTIRGERSRFFGARQQGLLGLRILPNDQIDVFIRAHMDDEAIAEAQVAVSPEARALGRGYVAGYNRYLRDHSADLPVACAGQPWVRPMAAADYGRMLELTMTQLGVAIMADAVVAASPPAEGEPVKVTPEPQEVAAALAAYRLNDPQLVDSQLGSNGWAFGSEVTDNGRGLLLGNPHFPWTGTNRFWQMHLTIPGELDVMGASIGHSAAVQVGFNRDVAWTHTVSTGKRFTLHELELVEGDPTSYRLDGQPVRMVPQEVRVPLRDEDGQVIEASHTVWTTGFGPIVEIPDAGLSWSDSRAYALKDANALNLRAMDIWVGFNKAASVDEMRDTLRGLGVPWVNTIAADRHGKAMYADVSVVPDIDAEVLGRCAPSKQAAALMQAAGLVVLDGSRSDCDWRADAASPVPGLTPIERMPVAVRRDWVQNSNDSFWLSNTDIVWPEFSPLIGSTNNQQRLRTRAGIVEIRERLAGDDGLAPGGKVGMEELQAMLFRNRNHAAELVLNDLLSICDEAGTSSGREACKVLGAWDRSNNMESRGAHLFREWWRQASRIDKVWRVPFNPEDPVNTPAGINTADEIVRSQLIGLLDSAVEMLRSSGFEIAAPLGGVQRRTTSNGTVGLHGGMEFEGVLNKLETPGVSTLLPGGYEIDFGSSYIQTVTFDDRGPVAEAILTYGQSAHPGSPFAFDQLPLYAEKKWLALPFHADDVAAERVGEVLRLTVD